MKIPADIKTSYLLPVMVRGTESRFINGGIPEDLVAISAADLVRLDYVAEDHERTRKILGADLIGPSAVKGSVAAQRLVDERDIARRVRDTYQKQRDDWIGEAERQKKRADVAEQKVHELRRDLTNFQSRHGAAACGLITTPPAPFNTRSGDVVAAQAPFNTTGFVAVGDIDKGDAVLFDYGRGTATSVGKAVPMMPGAESADALAAQARRLQREIAQDREKAIREANARAVERLRNLKADVLALYDQMIAAMTPKP